MTTKIKEMLQDKDSCNDELNARIWCFGGNALYDEKVNYHEAAKAVELRIPSHTTSLDAAMSIGKDKLEGWQINIDGGWKWNGEDYEPIFSATMHNGSIESGLKSPNFKDLPRAICFARISALEYVRGQ